MTLRQWLFDVTPSGSTLNTSNVVSVDSVAASAVSAGAGGTITSSDTHVHHGDTSAQFQGGGTNTQQARLPFPAAAAAGAVSLYHWGGTLAALDFINVRHSSGQLFRIAISGTGSIQVKDATGVVLGSTATGAWAIDRWNRIEFKWDNSGGSAAGVIDVEVYVGDDTTTPTGTLNLTGVNLGTANAATMDIGSPNAFSYTNAHWFDSVQMDNGRTTFIGPYVVVNQAPEVTAGPAQTLGASETATLGFSVVDLDGTIASRATTFDHPASGGPSISGGNTNSPSFTTQSAPRLYIVRHTATDDDGAEGSATAEVRVPSTGSGVSLPVPMDATAKTGTWTLEGDADTDGEALADSDDDTYLESGNITGTAQEVTVRLMPRSALASGTLTVRLATDTGSATATVKLRRGTTVLQQWTQAVTSTPTDYDFTLSGTAVTGANVDPGDLRISVSVAS
jgi:hypothetical protein